MENNKIAYIMSRFPHLSETFILREMIGMEKLGWDLYLYPLIVQNQEVIHPSASHFLERVQRSPFFSTGILFANIEQLIKKPGLYLKTLVRIVVENLASLKFLIRSLIIFPKSILMAKSMRTEGISHIHAHYATHPALAAWIINQFSGIPYSITVHAHDIFVDQSMLGTKVESARWIVAISEFNKLFLESLLGTRVGPKIRIIHCGVDLDKYSLAKPERHSEVFRIISIGSLQPYKGQKFLIEACRQLKDRNFQFECLIIGGGELMSNLQSQIDTLDLGEHVKLMGPKTEDEVVGLLKSADCYVQPSIITDAGKMEGIPVSLMEAMASGIPVVATSISGVPELVEDKVSGLLVEPEDISGLVNAVLTIAGNDEIANTLSLNGRRIVEKEFSLQENTLKLSGLLLSKNTELLV